MRSNKKGVYFFLFDVFIAAAVLVVSLQLISSSYVFVPKQEYYEQSLYNYIYYLTSVPFSVMGSDLKNELVDQGILTSDELEDPVKEVMVKLYVLGEEDYLREAIEESVNLTLPFYYGIDYYINNTLIYHRNASSDRAYDQGDVAITYSDVGSCYIVPRVLKGDVLMQNNSGGSSTGLLYNTGDEACKENLSYSCDYVQCYDKDAVFMCNQTITTGESTKHEVIIAHCSEPLNISKAFILPIKIRLWS